MRAASLIEVALENLITSLYLKKESAPEAPAALGQGRAQSPRDPQPERADDGRREAPDVAT
jgi:hypothetical protein